MRNKWWSRLAPLAMVVLAACGARQQSATVTPSSPPAETTADSGASSGAARGRAPMQVVSFASLRGWASDDHAAALASFQRSCDRLLTFRSTRAIGGPPSELSDWRPACEAARTVRPETARVFFEMAFRPVVIGDPAGGRLTGYFEPELDARRTRGGAFQHPIYRAPEEIVLRGGEYGVVRGGVFGPFPERREIVDGGLLEGRGLEIAYLNDPVDVHFLQIQGSGRLRFGDGSVQRVGFASKNGHPFRSIARAAIDRGHLSSNRASFENISVFVRENPEAGGDLLNANPSYVFFREMSGLDPDVGPVGALGNQLTAGRSIAVDRAFQPVGAPVWLERDVDGQPVGRLVIAQDVGAAILGAQRADYFTGFGDPAFREALAVGPRARLTTLLPTSLVDRLAAGS